MIWELGYTLLGLVLILYGLDFALEFTDDPREPPRIRPRIPLVGHLLGLIRNGTTYYSHISKTTNAEIYTLGIFSYKLYISNSVRLLPSIQKASRTLSFKPFIHTSTKSHSNVTDDTYHRFGDEALLDKFSHAMRTSLAPGPQLDEQNMRMGNRAIVDIDELLSGGSGQTKQFPLQEWVRHAVVQATSCGVYGKDHMFIRPELEKAYWTWQSYIPMHFAGLDVFGTGYAARELVFEGYRKFMKNMPEDVALVIKERIRVQREAGVPDSDIAQVEASFAIAAFGNSGPTLFWAIWELFSRHDVLDEVRKELASQAVTGSAEEGFQLDVAALKHRCPVLLSVYQETQRTRHVHANIRKVLEDTLLDGKYLLKKGNFLQMPGAPIHAATNIWGASASEFDPYRFVSGKNNYSAPASAFLAWGAPPHLCPARQFATTELLIILALLALRADLRPVGGVWDSLDVDITDMVTILNPRKDVKMDITGREEWAGKWSLMMTESTNRISLASG